MDTVEHGEMAEKELDAMIRRRSRQKDPDEEHEMYRESVRRYQEGRRRDLDAERHEYHAGQAVRLRRTLESLCAYHEAEAEKYLPKGAA